MKKRLVGVLGTAVLVTVAGEAHAQSTATLRAVVRVVRLAQPGSARLENAKVGEQVRAGGRVRTAGRSAAGLRFPDQSVLRLGPLTEVQITNPARRDTRVLRGQIFANYRGPGTIRGGFAVCAVRGTDIHFVQNDDAKTADVRCYNGRVFVGAADNPLAAGAATSMTGTTLTDPLLVGSDEDYSGGEIRFTDGPHAGQTRSITRFDAASGTVTFSPALAAAGGGGTPSGYLLAKRAGRTIVELRKNEGTLVRQGQDPQPARQVPGGQFGGLQQRPFYVVMNDGINTAVYNGEPEHQDVQTNEVATREAIERGVRRQEVTDQICLFDGTAGLIGLRAPVKAFGLRSRMAAQIRQDGQAVPGTTPEQRNLPQNVSVPREFRVSPKLGLRVEPFGILADEGRDIVGGRVRVQGSTGEVYSELGYRYASIDGNGDGDISEAFVQVRGKHGEVIAGRQHLFLRLANNTNVGTLLGLDTTDALVYQLPLKGGFRQSVGYIWDTGPLENGDVAANIGGGFKTFFLRGQARVNRGNAGYSMMIPTSQGRKVGWSVDAAQPILPNKLDIYGEIGQDTFHNNLYVAGLYFPALYHATKLDLFFEYHNRRHVDERWTLRLRRDVYKGLLFVAFVDRVPGNEFNGGFGLLYSHRFR